ncbi:MAG: ABC transporter permease, partial [Acidobacteria bacterium]|nr:ABC transporter permease [Acidobacteriota bacterium]
MRGKTSVKFSEAVKIAASSLWAHKLRSVLTLLGVVIGVMAVIVVVSLINGLNAYVAEKVFNLGADVFLVNRGPIIPLNIDDFLETQKRKKFTLEDFEAVRES